MKAKSLKLPFYLADGLAFNKRLFCVMSLLRTVTAISGARLLVLIVPNRERHAIQKPKAVRCFRRQTNYFHTSKALKTLFGDKRIFSIHCNTLNIHVMGEKVL